MYTKHHHELRHARKPWPGTLVDPCLLSGRDSSPLFSIHKSSLLSRGSDHIAKFYQLLHFQTLPTDSVLSVLTPLGLEHGVAMSWIFTTRCRDLSVWRFPRGSARIFLNHEISFGEIRNTPWFFQKCLKYENTVCHLEESLINTRENHEISHVKLK
jgi:hypothetical protein